MKYIKKRQAPQCLRDWIRANKDIPGVQYGSHGFPKDGVRDALLSEQGNLCAYAMVPLGPQNCHIEHVKPQELSRAEQAIQETWDYINLLACYPGNDPCAAGRNQFGATKKGNTWNAQKFISPLQASCESHFQFAADGSVSSSMQGDHPAMWTINTLGLDCDILAEWRRAAIEAFGVSLTSSSPLKRPEAERLRTAIRRRKADGSFHGYCVAVENAAEEYIATLEKLSKKKKFATRSRTGKGRWHG